MTQQETHWLAFTLQEVAYALPISQVVEVIRMVAITSLPDAPPWLAGVINLRGTITPVINLRIRLSLPTQAPTLDTPIIITQFEEGLVGLIIDSVRSVIKLPIGTIDPPNSLVGANHPICGMTRLNSQLLFILDINRVILDKEPLIGFSL
jgi:purine-binding chemotaxis protein CheW